MKILYTNGCSYTANFDLDKNNRYPTIVSKELGWKLKDGAEPGSCNSRIIRTTINDCIPLIEKYDITALIQLSHIFRTEYPTENNPLNDPFFSITPNAVEMINDETINNYINLYWQLHSDKHVIINLITGLIGLVGFFYQYNIKYKIFLGPNECRCFNIKDPRLLMLKRNSNILNLSEFYMLGLTNTPSIHPNNAGMQQIAEYFINLLDE